MTVIPSGGFDIKMTLPALSIGESISILADIDITPALDGDDEVKIKFISTANGLDYVLTAMPSDTNHEQITIHDQTNCNIRVAFFSLFIIIYVNDRFVHLSPLDSAVIPEHTGIDIRLLSSANKTVTNVVVTELSDWKSANYIDLDSNGQAGISSILEDRPVEIFYLSDGQINFAYDYERSRVTIYNVSNFVESDKFSDFASDITIFAADVDGVIDTDVALKEGFIPSLINLSSLDQGAVEATKEINKQAKQAEITYDISMALDPRVEIGDIVEYSDTQQGTNRTIEKSAIVEAASIMIGDGYYSTTIAGRHELS